jgi:Putative Flp pilus-assembly TadE/G-like
MRSTVPSTRTKSPQRKLQEGQAIVLIALLILVLFGMLGLAIDSGRSYVDRRDQQTAVDAAALAAGDYYDNYPDLLDVTAITLPAARQVYENNLHLYGGYTQHTAYHYTNVGASGNLVEDQWKDTFAGGYQLTITAINTLFNGYQFQFDSTHGFPLAFMQIFGGPANVTINATASSIVGNQRQTPALLTLNTVGCSTTLGGNGSLTVLGDVYSNGEACVNGNLHLAGTCYGAANSTCSQAGYYCYNSTPGFVPYAPPCHPGSGDITGTYVVPAPSLPDPGYIAPSVPYYQTPGQQLDRGNYTEMTPGTYGGFSLTGGAGCYFLDAGIYSWNGGYSSHGGLVSNELKAPNEELWGPPGSGPGTTAGAVSPFWTPGGCEGSFTTSVVPAPSQGIKHNGGGNWGIEVTAVRYDRFIDPTLGVAQNPCFASPGCRRESTPSSCVQVSTTDSNNNGINVNITNNSPGAQYYLVYIDKFGCETAPTANPNNFTFVGRFLAPGWTDVGGNPPATAVGGSWTGTLANLGANASANPYGCTVPGVSICNFDYNSLAASIQCFAQTRSAGCQTPDDETKPQCFQSCPPVAATPQENAPMALEYLPYTGGDVANENYCQVSPLSGDPNAPCTTAKVTPGAVQFYFPNGSCMDQNGGGYTHVFSGEQYNWIIIYSPPGAVCPLMKLNGNAFTQYIGTIYTPSSNWDILGTDKAPLAGQVICFTATVTGNGSAGIDFNPNYAPAPPAARLIN